MSQQLINLSPDLLRLQNEGYEITVKDAHSVISNIPYVDSNKQIRFGTLVSDLTLRGNITCRPSSHVMYFLGVQPCNKDGSPIQQIMHSCRKVRLTTDISADMSFSNKPSSGYTDYYHKFTQYISIITAPAYSLDPNVNAKTFKPVLTPEESEVFNYIDTNSGRAGITAISSTLKKQKIGIIGLGGTGSYILDFVTKTPVQEIHLFDADDFVQHNAFRSPGAASLSELRERQSKVDYHKSRYQNMHRGIVSHACFIDEDNVDMLRDLDFVFISIDEGSAKKVIFNYLTAQKIAFVDVGIGIEVADDKLTGILRTTLSTPDKNSHIDNYVPYQTGEEDEYASNIQISELNALNAVLAVIKWKKVCGYYHDHIKEYNSTYTINAHMLVGEEEFAA